MLTLIFKAYNNMKDKVYKLFNNFYIIKILYKKGRKP